MEPELLTITREELLLKKDEKLINGSKERHPGDGMECHTIDDHIKFSTFSYKNIKKSRKAANKVPVILKKPHTDAIDIAYSSPSNDQHINIEEGNRDKDLLITIDTLEMKLRYYESHNNQLIEEKIKLSQQLGVQTQVNNELKKLLVASIGEDLQQKYERLIVDKSQADLELKHLHSVVEEDREEVEQAMIHADVWRSKFLACRVLSDELARWKSALHHKYKDAYHALQNLLEEHSKIRALNNATKRGLTKMTEVFNCKDRSLDVDKHMTTIDVAFLNNDLVNSLLEIMQDDRNSRDSRFLDTKYEIKPIQTTSERGKSSLSTDIFKRPEELTPAELLAHEVIVNTDIETAEVSRMRRDYLAHNRISHFLSTNYHVTFNCCESCQGQVKVI